MFLYGLDRFSVDLDFDIIAGNIEDVMARVEKIVSTHGTIIQKTKTKIILRYPDGNMPLKIEINTRVQKHDRYETLLFFGTPMMCMEKTSIFANKLYTIAQRKERTDTVASRDLYDIWYFFSHQREINHALLQERSGKTTKEFLSFLKDFIPTNFNKNNLLLGL
jgi:predicted nucleotidyltransferase component of viral defense system